MFRIMNRKDMWWASYLKNSGADIRKTGSTMSIPFFVNECLFMPLRERHRLFQLLPVAAYLVLPVTGQE